MRRNYIEVERAAALLIDFAEDHYLEGYTLYVRAETPTGRATSIAVKASFPDRAEGPSEADLA